jgi:hypothetical protein
MHLFLFWDTNKACKTFVEPSQLGAFAVLPHEVLLIVRLALLPGPLPINSALYALLKSLSLSPFRWPGVVLHPTEGPAHECIARVQVLSRLRRRRPPLAGALPLSLASAPITIVDVVRVDVCSVCV